MLCAAWIGVVAGLSPAVAEGQDVYRQTVVVTASATPVELGSITRSLTVLTRAQISDLPVHTVADVLRLAASVDVRARGERGVQTDFAIRGANFGQMLVLVDGVRLNDTQSGHHNGDIPVPIDAVERIEILYGPGSSLFGADAFGGTINVITRRTALPSLVVQGGTHGFASSRAQAGFEWRRVTELLTASVDRSHGFMYDRDFKTTMARSRTTFGERSGLSVAYLWKEFGANNFYGGSAPSREWTNQMLVSADHRVGVVAGWNLQTDASYRTHGDHFIFNQTRPELSDNRHRTHAGLASLTGTRPATAGGTVTVGVEGGADWIRSSNLGDHSLSRVSGFGEWRQKITSSTQIDATLRLDRYSEFGTSWNPSVGAGWWPSARVRFRASAGRAFRVPTFTERYYSDPANLARADVGPETSWSGEGGADVFLPSGWMVQGTVFGRADDDVIDWLRPSVAVRWQTYNVRNVNTRGVEIGLRKGFSRGAFLQVDYTALDLDAAEVTQLSKYVLDYAPRSLTAAASIPLPGRVRVAPRVEYRQRSRSTGTNDYVLLDARVGRRFSDRYELFVEGTNLFDVSYQEIAGVDMPGAAISVSLAVGAR